MSASHPTDEAGRAARGGGLLARATSFWKRRTLESGTTEGMPVPLTGRVTRPAALAGLAGLGLALALQVVAIHRQSPSGDGVLHMVAGHQALRYGTNAVNLEHPPLVKLLVALPLLADRSPMAPPLRATDTIQATDRAHAYPGLLLRSRQSRYLVLVVFGLPLVAALYYLGRASLGPAAGLIASLLLVLSFPIVPLLASLQTDTAVTAGFALTVAASVAWRRRPTPARAVLMGLALGLAVSSKFSGLLLLPTVALAVLGHGGWSRRIATKAAALLVVLGVATACLAGTYRLANLNYDRASGRQTLAAYSESRASLDVGDALLPWQDRLLSLESWSPSAAQFLVGILGVRAHDARGVYASYAFGRVTSEGRWWYFPALLVVKTSLVVLLPGLWFLLRRRGRLPPRVVDAGVARDVLALSGVTVAVYLVVAMASTYNLGYRHLFPVVPFLCLGVAVGLARRPPWLSIGVVALLAAESVVLAPLWLSATHTWWLGDGNPTRFAFSAGNLEFRQNFLELERVTRARGIPELGVLYPTLAPEVLAAYLPASRLVHPGDPLPEGWYAVNVLVEQLVPGVLAADASSLRGYETLRPTAEAWQALWHEVRTRGEDHGYLAATFHLYLVPAAEPAARLRETAGSRRL